MLWLNNKPRWGKKWKGLFYGIVSYCDPSLQQKKGGNPRRSGNYGKVRGLGGRGQNTTFTGVLDHVNYDKKNNDNSDLNFLRVTLWCIIIIKLAALKFLVMW